MRMPFGQHRGCMLADVPDRYLWWAIREAGATVDRYPGLRRAIDIRLGVPYASPTAGPSKPPPTGSTSRHADARALVECVRGVLKIAYREESMRCHPDRGGSTDRMIGINELNDRLNALLDRQLSEFLKQRS